MTRKDIKKQLEKNPLVWKSHEGMTPWIRRNYAKTYFGHGRIEYEIVVDNELDESTLAFCVNDDSEYIDVEGSLSELKTIAEDHRLDLICQMLGITE